MAYWRGLAMSARAWIRTLTVFVATTAAAMCVVQVAGGGGRASASSGIDPGYVTTFAGNGSAGNTDGSGSSAQFMGLSGISEAGTAIFATENNSGSAAVRQVDSSTAQVSTVIHSAQVISGSCGYTDGTTPTTCDPWSPASDGTNLYFLDSFSGSNIREYTPSSSSARTISTITSPRLTGLAWGNNTLYVDNSTSLMSVDTSSGATTTLVSGLSGLGQIFAGPSGLWIDSGSSLLNWTYGSSSVSTVTTVPGTSAQWQVTQIGQYLYVGSPTEILRYDTVAGVWTGVAGNPNDPGFADGTGEQAWLNNPYLYADSSGTVWVADRGNNRIRTMVAGTAATTAPPPVATTVAINPGTVTTFAGAPSGSVTSDGYGHQATVLSLNGLTAMGNTLYLAQGGAQGALRSVDTTTGQIKTLLTNTGDSGGCTFADGTSGATVCYPQSLTTDGNAVYFVDQQSGMSYIRRYDPQTSAVLSAVAAPSAGWGSLVYGTDGNFYLGTNRGIVYQVDITDGVMTTVISGLSSLSGVQAGTTGLWLSEGSTSIYSLPYGSHTQSLVTTTGALGGTDGVVQAGQYLYAGAAGYVERYDTTAGTWTTIVGQTSSYGNVDGTGSTAKFNGYTQLVIDNQHRIWAIDSSDVRMITDGYNGAPLTSANLLANGNLSMGCSCAAHAATQKTQHPVNDQTGNFWHTFTDLSIPGRGMALDFTRSYNSDPSALSPVGPFGPGWSFSYGMSLSVNGSTVTINQENGSQVSFTQSGSSFSPTQSATLASLVQNLDGTYTFTRRSTQTFQFSSSGQLTAESDLNGYNTTISYPTGQMVITDPSGRTLTATITGGHIVALADQGGRNVSYAYDANGNLISVTDVNGGITSFAYDSSHRMVEMRSPLYYTPGDLPVAPATCASTPPTDIVSNVYDSSGRVICQWDADGRQTSFDYTSISGATKVTDPKGNVTVDYFNNGLLTAATQGYGTSSAAVWTFGTDPITGATSETVDPNGHVTQLFYDPNGNLLTSVDPLGRVTTRTYNNYNEITSVTLPATYGSAGTATTTYTYDEPAYSSAGAGNLTTTSASILSPTGSSEGTQVTHYIYGDSSHPGNVTSMIDPGGNTWSYTYDTHGDEISQTAPATTDNSDGSGSRSNVTKWAYDTATGSVVAQLSPRYVLANPSDTTCTTPAVGCTTYTADNMGRNLTTTDGNGHVTTNHYDADGNRDYSIDADNNRTSYTYDPAGQLTTATRPDTTTTKTNYWPDGSVEDQIDATNADTHYTYDPLGHLTGVTDPDNRTTGYAYDPAGNLLVKSDPGVSGCTTNSTTKGCTIYAYDVANELTSIKYNDPGVTPDIAAVNYDPNGRRTSMTEQVHGSTTNTVVSTWTYDSLGRTGSATDINGNTVSYGYDSRNELTSITYPGTTGTITQTYDPAGRLQSLADWLNNTTTYTYDADGNLATQTAPTTGTPVVDTSSFDNADNLTSIAATQGSTTIDSFNYGLDPNNQVGSVTSTGVPADNHTYGYNSLNQLTQIDSNSSYSYDHADNPISLTGGTTQAFDAANQLCWSATAAGSACGTPPTGATTYSYDTRGDLTTITPPGGPATTLVYDQAKRLTSYGTSTTYTYNGDGLRMTKTASGTTENYTYDQADHILVDGTTDYIYGLDGKVLEQITGTIPTWYHHDRLGSTRVLTDNAGAVVGTFTYDPYGNTTTTTGTETTPIGYAGGYKDAESGFVYLINRYYDSETAQYLNVDPAVGVTQQPYSYVNDNPLNKIDPLGLWGWNPIKDVTQAWNDTGGKAAHWAKTHPREAIGIGLGIVSVATGGIGLGADLAFEGTLLTTTVADTTAVATGAGAAYLDTGKCLGGDNVACVGAGLGLAGAAGAVPTVIGDFIGVEADTLPFAAIKGASAFGLLSGLAATVFDPFAAAAADAATCL